MKPGFYYDYDDNGNRLSEQRYIRFATYRKLKSSLKEYLQHQSKIFVSRSRRGEWGEWYEHWELNHKDKPYIVKQGWM
jgi:hypothetical protein